MTSYTVYSDGWGRTAPSAVDAHEATLRVLKDGLPYDGVRAQISAADATRCDPGPTEYDDPFWDALLVVAAREAEGRIRQGGQPSRSPDGPVIRLSYQLANAATGQPDSPGTATTELLTFGVE